MAETGALSVPSISGALVPHVDEEERDPKLDKYTKAQLIDLVKRTKAATRSVMSIFPTLEKADKERLERASESRWK